MPVVVVTFVTKHRREGFTLLQGRAKQLDKRSMSRLGEVSLTGN